MSRTPEKTIQYPKTLLIGVQTPYNQHLDLDAYLAEFENLAKSNGVIAEKTMVVKLREINSATFFTTGKLEEIKQLCAELKIAEVIISETLNAQQERNLDRALDCKIIDRTRLILEIFNRSALTAEGQLQVQVAYLQFLKSRLSGKGIHLSQQLGMIGTRGPGETAKERETQHIEEMILKLKRRINKTHQVRETQRKQRLRSDEPLICLIGYTNSGKSTILNSLTNSTVLAEDKLFATLDTTSRELFIDHKKIGIISDTVGFIQQLPHKLIEAFKATLSELQHADLLLLVTDIADKNWKQHIQTVLSILEELKVQDKKILYVFNKADKLTDEELTGLTTQIGAYSPYVVVSAKTKVGLEPLSKELATWFKHK